MLLDILQYLNEIGEEIQSIKKENFDDGRECYSISTKTRHYQDLNAEKFKEMLGECICSRDARIINVQNELETIKRERDFAQKMLQKNFTAVLSGKPKPAIDPASEKHPFNKSRDTFKDA